MATITFDAANLIPEGPVIDVLIGLPGSLMDTLRAQNRPVPSPVQVKALIDTGASSSVVQPSVIQQLGLQAIGVVGVNTPSCANVQCGQYHAGIFIQTIGRVDLMSVIEAPLQGQNIQCLIGRDFLQYGMLIYNGPEKQFVLAF